MTMKASRRSVLTGSAMLAVGGALASCSFEKENGSGSTSGDGSSAPVEININAFGPKPTFIENFNPFSPTDGVVGSNYFYDPLGYVDANDENNVKPWLAESIEFDAEAQTATVTLRDDITWSDGEKITSDDLIYSINDLPKQAEKQKATAPVREMTAKAVDDRVVEITFNKDKRDINGQRTLAAIPPYPRHVFEKEDLAKFTNQKPVSSSPLVIESFSPQRVSLKVREDHFMGKWQQVNRVNWVPFGSAEIGKSMILQGKLDMGTMSMQNAQDTIVKPGNHYWVIELVGSEGILFNCGRAPFNDKYARNAIYAALDTDQIHSLFDIGLPSTSPSTMDEKVFGDAVAPEYREPHKADPAAAKKWLADGGWTVEGGNLTKDGKSYPISFKTVAEYVNWSTWSDGVKAQLNDVLGIDCKILKVPDDQLSEQSAKGEFDLLMTWVGGGPHLAKVYVDFDSKKAVPVGEEAEGNYGRVKNPELDKLLAEADKEFDETKLKELSQQMQKIVVDECYCAPFNPSASFIEASGKNLEGFPEAPLPKGEVIPRPYGPEGWQTMSKLTKKS